MRAAGINWLAVIAAAVAIYVIGFVMYGLIIPEEAWMRMTGMTEEQKAIAQARMPFGVVMPIMTAVFLALLFNFGRVAGLSQGAQWGLMVALASAVPTVWYGYVYGGMPAEMTLVDSVHLFFGHIAAGAILGAWR